MREVFEIIKQIQATSGRNDKEAILAANKDNSLLRKVLYNVYNPYLVFGIKDKKLSKFLKTAKGSDNQIPDLLQLFAYLKLNNTGTDLNVRTVAQFINAETDADLREFYTQCATKDLKCGVTSKTINKAFNEQFIPLFECMLAEKFHKEMEKIKGDFFVTLKLDGFRMLAFKENGSVKFFSRQGQPLLGLEDIIEDMAMLPDNMVYDGELLLRNNENWDSKKLYSETSKVARKDGIKKNLEFYIFDFLPISEFYSGRSTDVYKQRRLKLDMLFSQIDLEWIKLLPVMYKGSDTKEVLRLLDEVDSKGLEGVMVNLADFPYSLTRSKGLLKAKKFLEGDFLIVGFEEGTGKYKGKLGRINIGYKNNTVGVGTGLSDTDRVEIWNNQDKYLGKIVKIKYFEESQNSKTGLHSLRFPVYEEIRWDKDEPNY